MFGSPDRNDSSCSSSSSSSSRDSYSSSQVCSKNTTTTTTTKTSREGLLALTPGSIVEQDLSSRTDLYWSVALNIAVLCLDNDVDVSKESAQALRDLDEHALATPTELNSLVFRVLAIDCCATESKELLIYRNDLEILDVKHIIQCRESNVQDDETIDFISAMIKFPEWDDFDRGSYAWPAHIIDMIKSPKDWKSWRKCIDMYMTKGRSAKFVLCHLLHMSRAKVYLFFMCLAHVGYDVDTDLGSLLNKLNRVIAIKDDNHFRMTSPARMSSPMSNGNYTHCRQRDSPLSQGSTGYKRAKSSHLCSLLSLGQPVPTISVPTAYERDSTITKGAPKLSLTDTESCVMDLIECVRSDELDVVDDKIFDSLFKRKSCRVGCDFQVGDLPECRPIAGSRNVAIDESCVFKPGVMNDYDIDIYLQQVYHCVTVEPGDLVGAWQPLPNGNQHLSSVSHKNVISCGGSEARHNLSISALEGDRQELDCAQLPVKWRIWNEDSRVRRLNIYRKSHARSGSGVKSIATPIGVVVACECGGTEKISKKIWIYNGDPTHFSVMTDNIRLMTFSEDKALDELHYSGYNSVQAVDNVARLCTSGTFRDTIHWSPHDINTLNSVFQEASLDIYSMFVKVRDARMQWARSNKKSIAVSSNSSTTAQDDARMHDVKQGREISMRDVIYFYFSFLATTARVEDEKIDNTSSVSPRPENETDLEAKKGNKGPNSREGISVPLMLARAHRVDTKAKCTTGGVPNRWPLSIPYVAHNLYFIGNSNTACICLGLEISNKDFNKNDTKNHDLGVTLRVLPISLSSYQYQQNLSPPSIKALNDINLQQISDARLIDFLMAMKDFAEQELRENPECMWYTFPSFLTNLISQPNDWKAWRKQVEKAAAAASANLPRQQVYYQALISEKLKKNEDRVLHTSLPWDDSVYEAEVEPTFSPVAKALPPSGAAGEKRKRSDSSEELSKLKTKPNKSVCNIPSVTVEVLGQDVKSNSQAELNCKPLKVKEKEIKLTKKTTGGTQQPKGRKLKGKAVGPRSCSPPPPPPINMSNLWWLSKSSLPCIFYGHTGDEFKDSFVVKPICCTTFHYEIKVRIQEIDVLTEDRLKLCTDDRTRDFACALLDFIEWETSRVKLSRKKSLSHESDIADESKADNVSTAGSWKPKTSGVSRLSVPYQWPDFVYDLIVYREKWNVWKKKVERSMRGNSKNGARRSAYLSTLIQNHLDLETERRMGIEEDASNGSECEVDSTGGGPDADDVEFDAHNGNNENELVSTTPGIEVQGARTGEHGDRGNDVSDGDTSRDEDDEDEDEEEEEEDEEEESFKTFIVRGSKHNESSSESNIIDSEEESKTITVDAEDTHKKCVPQYAKSSEIKIKSLSETNAIDNEEESSSDSMIDESEEYVGKVGGKTHAPENVYDIINYKDSRLDGKIIESAASSNVATAEMEKIEVISVSESVSGSEEDESSEESSEEGDGTSSNNPICMLISDGDDDEDDDDDDDDEEIPRHGLNINPRFKENGDGVRSSLFYRKGVREAIKDNDDYCHDQGPDSDSTRVKGPRNYGSR